MKIESAPAVERSHSQVRRGNHGHKAFAIGFGVLLLTAAVARTEAQALACVEVKLPSETDWIARPDETRILGTVVGVRSVKVPDTAFPGQFRPATVHEVRVDEWMVGIPREIGAGTLIPVIRSAQNCYQRGARTPLETPFLTLGSRQVLTGVLREPLESLGGRHVLDIGLPSLHKIPEMEGSDRESAVVWDFITWVMPDHGSGTAIAGLGFDGSRGGLSVIRARGWPLAMLLDSYEPPAAHLFKTQRRS